MRASRLIPGLSGKGIPAWILLAKRLEASGGSGEKMQWLPKIRHQDTYAYVRTQNHTNYMAICGVVLGYGWPVQTGERKHDTHFGHGGQVYKIDRSEAYKKM